jgi:Cu/Ag efflux protein CusF
MKKLSIILISIIFVLSTTGVALAQEKAKPGKSPEVAKPGESAKAAESAKAQAPKSEEAKPEKAKKEAPAKLVKYRMGGVVAAIDAAAKKITIKQDRVKRERIVTLRMGQRAAKELTNLKVGDAVNVWVSGKVITALQKVS